MTAKSAYCNPHLTYSPESQRSAIESKLTSALERWLQWSKDSTAPGVNEYGQVQTHSTVLRQMMRELSALCRLLLLGGPGVLSLAKTVGFRPNTGFTIVDVSSMDLPYISDETVAQAWKVLDILEAADSDSSNASDMHFTRPYVCFTAGLVVWAGLRQKHDELTQQDMARSKSLIRLFESQLSNLVWPCASFMKDILRDLRLQS